MSEDTREQPEKPTRTIDTDIRRWWERQAADDAVRNGEDLAAAYTALWNMCQKPPR